MKLFSVLFICFFLLINTVKAEKEVDYNDVICPKDNSGALTKDEYVLLMERFIEVLKYDQPVKEIMEEIGKYKCLIKKIRGELKKKNENEIRTLITLIEIIDTTNQSSEIYQIEDGLYERFLLQPNDYFEALKWRDNKQASFCTFLANSTKSYMIEKKIKPKNKDFQKYFYSLHSTNLEKLDGEEEITHCLKYMGKDMPDQSMY